MKIAILFQEWLINDVLPSLRKYGKYIITTKLKTKIKFLNKKIKLLEKYNNILKSNMTKHKYPTGMHIYVIKYNNLYKIGYTNDLNKRLATYNTGSGNKLEYEYYKKTNCAKEIELCLKAMLNRYLYRSNKEFYDCDINIIINKITKCLKIEKNCKNCNEIVTQNGGSIINHLIEKYNFKLNNYKQIIKN